VISPGAGRAALAENSAPHVVEEETTMTERSAVKSAWAEDVTYFAVALLITAVVFQVLQGLGAVFSIQFYVAAAGHVFSFNVTAWG
jgi:hypothetical protein